MKFAIQINEGPYQHQASDSAYFFTKAALEKGHEVFRVFFYHDGVNNSTRLTTPPQDDRNVVERWAELAEQYDLDMVVCVAAAQRRGIVDEGEAKRNGKDATNIRRASASPGWASWSRRPFNRTAWSSSATDRRRNTMSETIKKFLYLNRKAPYGTIYAWESLEVVLIGAAFDQDVSLAFVDDGVYQLTKGQDTAGIGMKNFSPTYAPSATTRSRRSSSSRSPWRSAG
jgi:tRNA 2-thiouridine synthesizing protein D